jgi:hypothetical protein
VRFFISCTDYREEVIGEPVEIEQLPGEIFAVHRSSIESSRHFPFWVVSHVQTGMQVSSGDTIDFAIRLARERFASKTPEQITISLEKGRAILSEKGVMPIKSGDDYRVYADDEDHDPEWVSAEDW